MHDPRHRPEQAEHCSEAEEPDQVRCRGGELIGQRGVVHLGDHDPHERAGLRIVAVGDHGGMGSEGTLAVALDVAGPPATLHRVTVLEVCRPADPARAPGWTAQ